MEGGGGLDFQQMIRETAHINGYGGWKHVDYVTSTGESSPSAGGIAGASLWLQSRFGWGREWLPSVLSSHDAALSQIAIASEVASNLN